MKTKLSERVRPDCEAAPWVIKEIKELEACLAFERVTVAELKADLSRARSNLTASAEAFQKLERANMDLREVNAQLTGANRELGVAIWSTASQLNDRASRLFQMHTDLVLKKDATDSTPGEPRPLCTFEERLKQRIFALTKVLTVIDEKFRDDSHLRRFPVIWGMVDQVLGRGEKKNPCTHSEGFLQLEGDTFCRQCGVNEEDTKKQP